MWATSVRFSILPCPTQPTQGALVCFLFFLNIFTYSFGWGMWDCYCIIYLPLSPASGRVPSPTLATRWSLQLPYSQGPGGSPLPESHPLPPPRSFLFSSVQSLSHVQLFATFELQHARPPCLSPAPGVYSNSCPSSR